jgi:tellurite resistance protein TerC
LEFLTGYLIEKSLSVDNIFVFLVIFTYFAIPMKYQHRTLFLGILGALVLRAIFIFSGVALLERFHWVIYIFGAFLIYTGLRLAMSHDKEIDPEKNLALRLFRRVMPVTDSLEGGSYFVRRQGVLMATPLFVVLLVIETTDVIFALDSIPAILAVTNDPFIVYTSNVFAILGLRALYFALAGLLRLFRYLHYGLAVILIFVGIKMMLSEVIHIPITLALGVIASVLTLSILASVLLPEREADHQQTYLPADEGKKA